MTMIPTGEKSIIESPSKHRFGDVKGAGDHLCANRAGLSDASEFDVKTSQENFQFFNSISPN